jgi:acyl dehydratase
LSATQFTEPVADRRFEDYAPGAVFECGEIPVTEAEIVAFARRFDPQYIHIDREGAAHGPFGGLIASGWHTAALMMRLIVDNFLPQRASLGSPGIDELRWLKPVRPGDMLSIRLSVLEATRSRSKPDRGVVRTLCEVLNQNREVVMSLKAMNIIACRRPHPTPGAPALAGGHPGAPPPRATSRMDGSSISPANRSARSPGDAAEGTEGGS